MSILGIGTDLVEIKRIEEVSKKTSRFCERVFTQNEIEHCSAKGKSCYASLAARFAAKEAVAKAFGRPLRWHDVEIITMPDGRPVIRLYGNARKLAENTTVHISLTHSKNYACATAIVEGKEHG
ncbi:MAG: holo-ACP synthase [Armatimonadota bacterium]